MIQKFDIKKATKLKLKKAEAIFINSSVNDRSGGCDNDKCYAAIFNKLETIM